MEEGVKKTLEDNLEDIFTNKNNNKKKKKANKENKREKEKVRRSMFDEELDKYNT